MSYIKQDEFIQIAIQHNCDPVLIRDYIIENLRPDYGVNITKVRYRIANYRRKGLLPLASGNAVDVGQFLKSTSTQYGSEGQIKQQWVKSDVSKEAQMESIQEVISELASSINPITEITQVTRKTNDELATLYISNDVHFGLLTWEPETGEDWNTDAAIDTMRSAYDYLFETSPDSKIGIVVDLGDMTEADDFSNLTPTGKNPLDTDSRYPKVLRAAYKSLIYAINKALLKHELVYFYNIAGNHDLVTAHAIREVILQAYKDNPRVIVDDSPSPIKYHQHDKTLLGFAHGDGLKMAKAGEVMAVECKDIFSTTDHRFFHFGHTHVDAVRDGPICKAESHRNVPPVNAWAHHKGYRRGVGTMKSITYHLEDGEVSRNTYNVK